MSVMESLVTRRTYRRFAQKPVPQDVVDDIVEAVRLSSCGANRQALRLVVVQSPEMVAKVQPLVKWAAYLPPEQGMPKADETPTLYVAVLQDSSSSGDLSTDTGILLHGPGKTPEDSLRFIVFIVETLVAVYKHNGLLKASIMSATNAHRLGANEAPPASFLRSSVISSRRFSSTSRPLTRTNSSTWLASRA